MSDILELTIAELGPRLRAGDLSPVEVTEACLARIEATEPTLGAYVCVLGEAARAEARQAEAEIARGAYRGPLHGVPVAVKDLYDMEGLPTTSSSRVRETWMPKGDSAVVASLRRAGAVILGKTHTHEFAYGIATPTTRNPWDTSRIPGGSSGGSGATVAARGAFMAMGTDTGGSIRIPAALCGTVGLKPTYGRISRAGVTSLAWGLDHAGPLTRSVADAALCLQVLAGYDPRDPGSLDEPVPDYAEALGRDIAGLRIGVPVNHFFDRVEPAVTDAVRAAQAQLEAMGAVLVPVEIPLADQIMAVEFAICLPEASAYHQRMLREKPDAYAEDVRLFLETGELVPATRYIQALRVRTLIQEGFRRLFEEVDAIMAPTVAAIAVEAGTTAFTWPDGMEEAITSVYVRLSAPANVTGLPSISVPCGFSPEGLPIGMQVIGRPLDEKTILRVADAWEREGGVGCPAPPL